MVKKRVAKGMDPIVALKEPSKRPLHSDVIARAKAREARAFVRRTYFVCGHEKLPQNSKLTYRGFRACLHCANGAGNYLSQANTEREAA
jgi:hypothetical protein